MRQVLRKRGPLEPFVAVAKLNRTAGLPFPALGAEERTRVWQVASKTLDAAFLTAVVDHLPDKQQRELLEQRLLGLGDQAARGTLRVVRCWGADIETPGDWAAAVAKLRLVAAIDDVEGVLDSAWPEQAVEALIRFGAAGAPALGRFLVTSRARQIDDGLRVRAIQSCALHLPEDDWQALGSSRRRPSTGHEQDLLDSLTFITLATAAPRCLTRRQPWDRRVQLGINAVTAGVPLRLAPPLSLPPSLSQSRPLARLLHLPLVFFRESTQIDSIPRCRTDRSH